MAIVPTTIPPVSLAPYNPNLCANHPNEPECLAHCVVNPSDTACQTTATLAARAAQSQAINQLVSRCSQGSSSDAQTTSCLAEATGCSADPNPLTCITQKENCDSTMEGCRQISTLSASALSGPCFDDPNSQACQTQKAVGQGVIVGTIGLATAPWLVAAAPEVAAALPEVIGSVTTGLSQAGIAAQSSLYAYGSYYLGGGIATGLGGVALDTALVNSSTIGQQANIVVNNVIQAAQTPIGQLTRIVGGNIVEGIACQTDPSSASCLLAQAGVEGTNYNIDNISTVQKNTSNSSPSDEQIVKWVNEGFTVEKQRGTIVSVLDQNNLPIWYSKVTGQSESNPAGGFFNPEWKSANGTTDQVLVLATDGNRVQDLDTVIHETAHASNYYSTQIITDEATALNNAKSAAIADQYSGSGIQKVISTFNDEYHAREAEVNILTKLGIESSRAQGELTQIDSDLQYSAYISEKYNNPDYLTFEYIKQAKKLLSEEAVNQLLFGINNMQNPITDPQYLLPGR